MSSAVYPSINPWALREEGGLINNLTAMHIITVFALEGVSFFPSSQLYSLTSCQKCFISFGKQLRNLCSSKKKASSNPPNLSLKVAEPAGEGYK